MCVGGLSPLPSLLYRVCLIPTHAHGHAHFQLPSSLGASAPRSPLRLGKGDGSGKLAQNFSPRFHKSSPLPQAPGPSPELSRARSQGGAGGPGPGPYLAGRTAGRGGPRAHVEDQRRVPLHGAPAPRARAPRQEGPRAGVADQLACPAPAPAARRVSTGRRSSAPSGRGGSRAASAPGRLGSTPALEGRHECKPSFPERCPESDKGAGGNGGVCGV